MNKIYTLFLISSFALNTIGGIIGMSYYKDYQQLLKVQQAYELLKLKNKVSNSRENALKQFAKTRAKRILIAVPVVGIATAAALETLETAEFLERYDMTLPELVEAMEIYVPIAVTELEHELEIGIHRLTK